MQIDMHYFGTYCMARAAGIQQEASAVIARSAQFVDDNGSKDHIKFADGARLDAMATAHHALDIANIDLEDQRQIWVPFHFIPGNRGSAYPERLTCQMDSEISQKMVDHHLAQAHKSFALELLGLTAHVYADTFSHYGFSGISSYRNAIVNNSIELLNLEDSLKKKHKHKESAFFKKYGTERTLKSFFEHLSSTVAEGVTGALGHGAVLTYPDRPYLVWSFKYEFTKERVVRDNPKTFLAACEKLYDMFHRFLQAQPKYRHDKGRPFEEIRPKVAQILAVKEEKEGRSKAWQTAAENGSLFLGKESIPPYDGKALNEERKGLVKWTDSSVVPGKSIFKFYQAASYHRNYVLRELLPAHELLIA